MNIYLRIACYVALFVAWGVIACLGKTPMEGFIAAVTGAIAALGANHLGSPASSAPPPAAPPKDTP